MTQRTAFLLQGARHHTLVGGKTTALRLFTDANIINNAERVNASIVGPGGARFVRTWTRNSWVEIPTSSNGPSIVVLIQGKDLYVGEYQVSAQIVDRTGNILCNYNVSPVQLLPTKDLRVVVSRCWSGTSLKIGELEAARDAMERLSELFPIRDGVSTLDGNRSAGLRYILDNNPTGPPNQDAHLGPLFDKYMNRPSNLDSVDVGIVYRFPNPGEGSGGNADHYHNTLRWSLIVSGSPLAVAFCHETGHIFGLVDLGYPQPNPLLVEAIDTEMGFDPNNNTTLTQPTFDIMSYNCLYLSDNSISFNSGNWESMRKQIAKLTSTGPTGPWSNATDLGGVELTSAPSAISRAPGRIDVFYRGPNNHLWTSWWEGGPWWSAPKDLGGEILTSAPSAVSRAPGRIDVFYLGPNNHLWTSWWDQGPGWSAPKDLGGETLTSAPTAVSRAPGRIDVFYRGTNKHLWTSWWEGGPWWSAPADLGGEILTSAPSAVSRITGRIDVFYRGTNNHLWTSWWDQGPWWSAPTDLGGVKLSTGPGAVSCHANQLDVFMGGPDNHLYVSWWDGGPWWSTPYIFNNTAISSEPAAVSDKQGHLYVLYQGTNKHLWMIDRMLQ